MNQAYRSNSPSKSADALAMRREFDLGFAQAPHVQKEALLNFLGIRLGDDAFAIRVSDIAGLHADRRIMPMPSPVPALLGVAGFRGLIAPVYDLAALLGYKCKTPPRWLILIRLGEPVALAFEHFEVHFSAEPGSIISAPQLAVSIPDNARVHRYDAVRADDAIRPIIHLQSLLAPILEPKQRSLNLSLQQRRKES
ncbi:chemotaxis protein CheW [Solimicrobium silvestre]|uniref:CheW-like domain n=1 Tax=Solimicrobium silvestre TaxID=2099400 RepID=A0A2S9H5M1_9BURK|nr:chemotaxis protein CheW [Solimicrobium silvestre]PRC95176.1 CheW-like domain [Solimicrobium silvestre]